MGREHGKRAWIGVAGAAIACAAAAGPALAGNGVNMLGFGTESVGMGGADTAVARDTNALNTNPAGIAQIRQRALDAYVSVAYALDVAHADALGNDRLVDSRFAALGGFGYTTPIGERQAFHDIEELWAILSHTARKDPKFKQR